MRIKRFPVPRSTIEQFADAHGLEMEVHERNPNEPVFGGWQNGAVRYFAHFSDCELMGDGVLIGAFGDGPTEEAAIAAYAERISGKRLVYAAGRATRREMDVPLLGTGAGSAPGVGE